MYCMFPTTLTMPRRDLQFVRLMGVHLVLQMAVAPGPHPSYSSCAKSSDGVWSLRRLVNKSIPPKASVSQRPKRAFIKPKTQHCNKPLKPQSGWIRKRGQA